jgi:signal peptidase I
MSSIFGLSEPADPNTVYDSPAVSAVGFPGKRLSAAVLSAIIPGAGQLLFGQVRSAALFLAGFAATLALFWPLRLPHSVIGIAICSILAMTFSLWAAWHAARFPNQDYRRLPRRWLCAIVPVALAAANVDFDQAMRVAGFHAFNIPVSAMANTLMIGDDVVVDLRYYRDHRPHAGDVIVFHHNHIWAIKRALALGGDTIYGRAGLIYLNGNRIYEPYVQHTESTPTPYLYDFGPLTIPNTQIFVMGDNRDVSYDSRDPNFGPVYVDDLAGKPLYIVRSRDRRRNGKSVR